jgi:signal peptidase I
MVPVDTQLTTEVVEIAESTPQIQERTGLRLSAALLSAILPGGGQWALKAGVNALLFNLAFVGLAVGYGFGHLPATDRGFMAALVFGWVLWSLSAWDALRNSRSAVHPKSPIWLAGFMPIAVLVSTAFGSVAMQAGGFRTYVIPTESMEHTLNIGDRLIVDTTYFKTHVVHSGDVIIFRKGATQFAKRVIATGGSQVEGINGVIYVGGEPLQETYVRHDSPVPDFMTNFGPVTVPDGELFVMGDNRDHSMDSRDPDFGLIPESSLVGKPLYIYYSQTASRNGRKIE